MFAPDLHASHRSDDLTRLARRMEAVGDVHAAADSWRLALEYYRSAVDAWRRVPAEESADTLARVLRKCAECQEGLGDLDVAASDLAEARRLLREYRPDLQTERGILLGRTAVIDNLQGRYTRAVRVARVSLAILRSTSEHVEVARAESLVGAIAQRRGEIEEARESYESALATFRRIGDRPGVARMLNNIANLLRASGNYREAVGYFQKAIDHNESLGNIALLAGNCVNLGIVHTFLAQWPQAEAALRRGRQLADQTGNTPQVVRALLTESILAQRRYEFDRAVGALDEASTKVASTGLRREAILISEFRADLLRAQGRDEEASVLYESALSDAQLLAPHGDIVLEVRRRRAEMLAEAGRTDEAREEVSQALAGARHAGERGESAACMRVIALCDVASGLVDKASATIEEVASIFESLGDRWELARTYTAAASALADAPGADPAIVRHWCRRAESLSIEIDDSLQLVRANLGLALADLAAGRVDVVFQRLDLAAGAIDRLPENLRPKLRQRISDARAIAESRVASSASGASGHGTQLIEHVKELVRGSANPREGLAQILRLLSETIGADRAFFARLGDTRPAVIVAHSVRVDQADAILRALEDTHLLGSDHTVVSTSVPADARLATRLGAFDGVRSFVLCPLGFSARDVGWLYVDRSTSSAYGPFLHGDINTALILAGLATVGVLESERAHLEQDYARLRAQLSQGSIFPDVVTQNETMRALLDLVQKVGSSDARVLVRGETGTGKGLIASCLHRASNRRNQRFIQVNCATFSEALLESELFGHVQGAFTGAVREKTGLFEEASKGTLFLDEIDKASATIQGKLLHVLDQSEIRQVGSNVWRAVDTRVVAATNVDLELWIRDRRFLEDLYYRLNDIVVDVPPLRSRREDIPLLAHHFLQRFSSSSGKSIRGFSDRVMSRLVAHNWPGNVRELEKAVHRMVVLAEVGARIEEDLLPRAVATDDPSDIGSGNLKREIEKLERRVISETLTGLNWNRTIAAKRLGISYPCLLGKIKQYGLSPS